MDFTNPDIDWYLRKSREFNLSPRCPFASVEICPRYYQSLSLLKETGATGMDPARDEELLEYWRKSDLWPQITEQATSVWGKNGNNLSQFCPEVTNERYGLFASDIHSYSDEIDHEGAQRNLQVIKAPRGFWGWTWERVFPKHYSECPLYSPLLLRDKGAPKVKDDEILTLKPGVSGISLDLKALWRRAKNWLKNF